MSQTLYRFWDAEDELLYVGISVKPWDRWKQHRGDKPWWEEVASVTLETFQTREEVAAAELAAIRAESPRYNIAGRGRPIVDGHVEPKQAEDWDGVHAPQIAYVGDLLWCTCNEPDWDSHPERVPFAPGCDIEEREQRYRTESNEWAAAQPYYTPEQFTAHVIEAVLGERFRVARR